MAAALLPPVGGAAAVGVSDVFKWHTRDETGGSLLKDYTISKVKSVSPSPDSSFQLRTLVVFATHNDYPALKLAIKITPIYMSVRRDDFVREQQIHYLLTQLDAKFVRKAAQDKKAGSPLFIADRKNPLEHEATVSKKIVEGLSHNVVPLYDFVIQQFDLSSIPVVIDRNKLSPFIWLNPHPASIMVQLQLEGTLSTLIEETNDLSKIVKWLRYTIIQMCCILHSLLAIGFTHGDMHPENIGYRMPGVKRHYFIAADKIFAIPDDVPNIMLLDFDTSRAEMKDATNVKFDMVPSRASLNTRFRGIVTVLPEQTFSPMVDVFRLVHSVAFLLAGRMTYADIAWPDAVTQSEDMRLLGIACQAGITKLPKSITDLESYKIVKEFCAEMMNPAREKKTFKDKAKALLADKRQTTLWWRVYAATPSTKAEVADHVMPWDVLYLQEPVLAEPDGSKDMTLSPLYKRNMVYQPKGVMFVDDDTMRVHPLKEVFTKEM